MNVVITPSPEIDEGIVGVLGPVRIPEELVVPPEVQEDVMDDEEVLSGETEVVEVEGDSDPISEAWQGGSKPQDSPVVLGDLGESVITSPSNPVDQESPDKTADKRGSDSQVELEGQPLTKRARGGTSGV